MAEEMVLRKNRLRLTGRNDALRPVPNIHDLKQFPESGHFSRLPATTAMGWEGDWRLLD